jgi:hypothetical protein
MTFWLVAAGEGETPDTIKQKPWIAMPDFHQADWSKATTRKNIKQQLLKLDQDTPPETLALQSQMIGRFMLDMHKEDIVCMVWRIGKKTKGVCFAEVVGKPVAMEISEGYFEHHLPIHWFKEEAKMLRLRPYIYELGKADMWPAEIGNAKFRLALRNHLPLPGNKFVRWGWLIVVLVCIKLFVLTAHILKRV